VLGNAQAADLPYAKAAPMPVRVYSWTGFYGGAFAGGAFANSGNFNLTADPAAGQTVVVGPATNGSAPIFSQAYNNLANGGIGQVSNTTIPGGVNCVGLVNCNVGGPATTSITPNANAGYRTDSMGPTSQNSSQIAALGGLEIGYRKQFDNNFVLGIGADIMGFTHGGSTNYNSTGSFYNSNGFNSNSQATGCIAATGGTCNQALLLNTSGSVMTVNSGGSAANLAISSNPNWIGTVRGSAGYAFDRLLIFGSAGLAYSDAKMNVTGSYKDTVSSACSGVSNVFTGGGNGVGNPGQSFVGYQCGGAAVNSASVNQLVTTSVTYTGNRGGMLTGFAAGGGMAYAVSDHISLTLEGMYYNLGTERVTVTGSGTQTTTTVTTGAVGTANGGVTPTPNSITTGTVAATASSFTVSKMIDGAIFKGGIQYKF
jgi:opacity protein-like surface antigen